MFEFLTRAVQSATALFEGEPRRQSTTHAPPPPPPAAGAPATAAADPARVTAATAQLHAAMDGLFTDETALLNTLRGRSQSEIAEIRRAYEATHHESLDSAIASELSGEDLQTAQYFLTGGAARQRPPAPPPAAGGTGSTATAPVSTTGPPATLTRVDPSAPQATIDAAAASGSTAPATTSPAPQPPPLDEAALNRAAGDIFRACDGMGTDEDAIHRALRGRSPAEVARLRAIYRDHYGRELDSELEGELGGTDWEQARAALSANPVDAAVSTLINASDGLGTNEEAIQQTLRGITDPDVRRQVAAEYERRTHQSLDTMLTDEMGGSDLEVSQLLQQGQIAQADAAALDAAMHETTLGIDWGTDEDRINQILESTPEADRPALLAQYQQRTNRSLTGDLRGEMDGPEGDISISLANGDRMGAAAARMANAADGMGTDEDTIFRQLEGRSEPERQAIIRAFNERYGRTMGSFDAMITAEMGAMDGERARQLADNGRLDPVFALRYAQDGAGTDEDMIRSALRGRSAAEVAEIQARYREAYGIDLTDEMQGELSGRDEHYIMQMMRGEPRTVQERLERANENWDFERGEGAGLFGGFTDCFYDAGTMLDRQHGRLQGLQADLAAATTAEERTRIEREINTVLGYQEQDVEAYHAAQDSVANNTAMAAALTASVLVTIASGGVGGAAAAPLVSMLAGSLGMSTGAVTAVLAAGAGGLATMASKGLILGDAYGAEAIGTDAAMTVAQMASGGILASGAFAAQPGQLSGFGQMLARNGINPQGVGGMLLEQSTQGLVGMGINGTTQAMLDENVWRGPGNGLARFGSILGQSFLSNAGAGIGTGGFNMMTSTPTTLAGNFGHGFVGGLFGGALQSAADPNVWQGRWEDVALRFGTNMGQNGLQTAMLSTWQAHNRPAAGGPEAPVVAPDAPAPDAPVLAPDAPVVAPDAPVVAPDTPPPLRAGGIDDDGVTVRPPTAEDAPETVTPRSEEPTPRAQDDAARIAADDDTPARAALDPAQQPPTFRPPDSDPTQHRQAVNSEATTARAEAAVGRMPPEAQAETRRVIAGAENDAQRVLLERALAAGRPPADVAELASRMAGMSPEQVLASFTGAGMFQAFQQSCVPTAFQIALAQVDPVFAMRMRDNPEAFVAMQAGHNAALDGARTPRSAGNDPGGHVQSQIESNPALQQAIDGSLATRGSFFGVNPAGMEVTPLHDQLSAATGATYHTFSQDGDATPGRVFNRESVPQAQMQAALDAGMPILFSSFGHEQAIVGMNRAADGTVTYLVHDPASGRTTPVPATIFDNIVPTSLTMPDMTPGVAGAEPTSSLPRAGGVLDDDGVTPTRAVAPDVDASQAPEGAVAAARPRSPAQLLAEATQPNRPPAEREAAKAAFLQRLHAGEIDWQQLASVLPADEVRRLQLWGTDTRVSQQTGTPAPSMDGGQPGHVGLTVHGPNGIEGHASFAFATKDEVAARAAVDTVPLPGELGPIRPSPESPSISAGRGGAPLDRPDGSPGATMPVTRKQGQQHTPTSDPFYLDPATGQMQPQDHNHQLHPDIVPAGPLMDLVRQIQERQALLSQPSDAPAALQRALAELNSVDEPVRPYFEGPVDEARPAVAALDQQRADSEYQIATTVPPADVASTPVGQRRIDQHPELGPTMQAQNCATELMWQLHAVGALSDADITMLAGNPEGMFSPRTSTDSGNDLTPQALIEHLMWLDYEHRMRLLEQQRQQSVDPVRSDGD